jgi:hypothetical protein
LNIDKVHVIFYTTVCKPCPHARQEQPRGVGGMQCQPQPEGAVQLVKV